MRLIEEAVCVLVLVTVTVVASFVISLAVHGLVDAVGGREQSSSGGGAPPDTARATQTAAAVVPAPDYRAEGDEVAVPLEEIQAMLPVLAAHPVGPTSTVVSQALTGEGGMPMGDSITRPYLPTRPTATVSPTGGGAYIAPAPPVASSYEAEARYWIGVYFPGQEGMAYRVASCETGGTFDPGAVGVVGEQGIFQVRAIYHGPVPGSIQGQVEQAAGIVARSGWGPWSCA